MAVIMTDELKKSKNFHRGGVFERMTFYFDNIYLKYTSS